MRRLQHVFTLSFHQLKRRESDKELAVEGDESPLNALETLLSRCDQVRAMQRQGGDQVTAVMVSRIPERVSSVTEFFIKHPEVSAVMLTRHTQEQTAEAFRVLKESLQLDSNYAWSWHRNIAMAFYDEARRSKILNEVTIAVSETHGIANRAAANFMKLCFEIDIQQSDEWRSLVAAPSLNALARETETTTAR